jgi:4-diphosphocytidyl-2-C-methyl-D-erythritol kinase
MPACQAKINWFLNIGERRADGYHSLQSVMQRISLHDTLTFAPAPAGRIVCQVIGRSCGCAPNDNLTLKAARALAAHCQITAGVRMTLTKRIPVSAGLGGGSSNAATALRALAAFWGCAVSADELHRMARALGADVPFFLGAPAALCEGIGDRLTTLVARQFHIVLWNPGTPLLTKDVYRRFDAQPRPQRRVAAFLAAYHTGDVRRLAKQIWNNLALAAEELTPELQRRREQMCAAGALATWVSGSGPTLIGLCAGRGAAAQVAQTLRRTATSEEFIHAATTVCDD